MKLPTYIKTTALLAAGLFITGSTALAQIKVGSNPQTLNANAVLEIESANKGLLLPRLQLVSTTAASPMSAFVRGMVVYNTATINDVTPGIYYSDGTRWIKINGSGIAPTETNAWSLNGNTGTNNNNFLGTTDNNPLRIKTNNTERIHIDNNGRVGIGTSTPAATLQVKGQVIIDSLTSGNTTTDNVLVAEPATGKVKAVPSASFLTNVQTRTETVATAGQTIFTTPATFSDVNKIMLFRNGVMISFIRNTSNTIKAEIACAAGDEIRIIQLL
ncbi:MAG: hypothetical protein JNM88_00690 [Chitinophagaceae bacterium]|nr:hypothetical protein [Chitinophagaceae bacterium]